MFHVEQKQISKADLSPSYILADKTFNNELKRDWYYGKEQTFS